MPCHLILNPGNTDGTEGLLHDCSASPLTYHGQPDTVAIDFPDKTPKVVFHEFKSVYAKNLSKWMHFYTIYWDTGQVTWIEEASKDFPWESNER